MQVELLYGPPGTGKTTELLNILEAELKVVAPDRIAYVSFTRKGTYEGRDRAMDKFGFSKTDLPNFRTIHSMAFNGLKMNRDDMINKEHYKKFSDALGMNFTGYYTEDLTNDDDTYLFFTNLYRNNPTAGEHLLSELNPQLLNWVTKNYKKFKNTLNIYDYTDLLEMYLDEGMKQKVDVVIIDEAQDLTTLQWKFIWQSFSSAKRMYVAGDDDQAIYEWSGADVNYFLNLKGRQTVLSKSWRLPQEVHTYAAHVAATISKRITKDFTHNGNKGHLELINSYKDLTVDSEKSWLFLSRTIAQMNKVESWMKSQAMVYEKKGQPSVNPDIVKAIHAHTAACKGKYTTDNERLLMKFYMEGAKTVFHNPWYEEFCRLKESTISYYRDLIASKTDLSHCNIKLSTIHGAKGGEADNVVLLLEFNNRIAQNMHAQQDSEMRCYYVGVTRARNKLFLVLPEGNQGYKYLGAYNE